MPTENFITKGAKLPLFRRGRISILALGLVLAPVATAQAADLCLNVGDIFGVSVSLVGKRFRLPPKNQCKPFNGFTPGGFSTFVVGTGCTSADGFAFHLSFTAHNTGDETSLRPSTVTGYCGFVLPGLGAGSCTGTGTFANATSDETFRWSSSASGQSCTVNVP